MTELLEESERRRFIPDASASSFLTSGSEARSAGSEPLADTRCRSAPRSSNSVMHSVAPRRAALCSGEKPPQSTASTSACASSMSSFRHRSAPLSAAQCSGVRLSRSVASARAPALSSANTDSAASIGQAQCSGVCSAQSRAFTSAPAAMRALTHTAAFLPHAQCSGVRFSRSRAFTSSPSRSMRSSSARVSEQSSRPPPNCVARWSIERRSSSTCVTLAPRSISSNADSSFRLVTASHRGVCIESFSASIAAPRSMATAMSVCVPLAASQCSGVISFLSVHARDAPASMSSLAHCTAPHSQAIKSGVRS
mmetsp:Transcript_29561/g.73916  ORF Transcript_29561/g.73916 Transcript_29561/m.73916 type:complete len:310 (+) Transcript_29561:869-1798(+)